MSEWTGPPGTPWRAHPYGWWESLLVPRATPGAAATCDVIDCYGRRTLVDFVGSWVKVGKRARGMSTRVVFVDVQSVSNGWRIS